MYYVFLTGNYIDYIDVPLPAYYMDNVDSAIVIFGF